MTDEAIIEQFETMLRTHPASVLVVGRTLFGVVFNPEDASVAQMGVILATIEEG